LLGKINEKTKMTRIKKIALNLFRASVYLLVFVITLTLVFGYLVIEDQPAVLEASAPTSQDVIEAREFVRGVRSAITPGRETSEPFIASETQLNSVIKLGTRLIAGFRGQLVVNETEVMGAASIPVPYTQETKWVNLKVAAPEFEGVFSLSRVSIGAISIPPKLALGTGRVAADVIVGNDFGGRLLSAATSLQINDDTVTFGLMMDEMGSNGLMRGIFGTLRGSDMSEASEIDHYYVLIRTAMDRGELLQTGSYLPYLQYTLAAALEGSRTEGVQNAYTSAIFALTMICGAADFTLIVGGLVGDGSSTNEDWKTDCDELTLNGRIDSRRHFTTAAAIQAASNRGFAVSVGEFKELYDAMNSDGFDFTDIAANSSGIRMSNTLMATPFEDWPTALERIRTENDVIVSFDGIPAIMSNDEFLRTYGDIESPEYDAMLDSIESKIDNLALNRE
jgi:hypothetical protein